MENKIEAYKIVIRNLHKELVIVSKKINQAYANEDLAMISELEGQSALLNLALDASYENLIEEISKRVPK